MPAQLPDPIWEVYFASQENFLIFSFKVEGILHKVKEFGLSHPTFGKLGTCAHFNIYEIGANYPEQIEPTLALIQKRIGFIPYDWKDIQEKGTAHPLFLPAHGCFGFINGHLILGNRHHMEIMYRLIEDKGWTWDELVNAEQVWGWYGHTSQGSSASFSSDAGIMSGEKTKKACLEAFGEYFHTPFKMGSGYGGKSKNTYGGNMEAKYGKPGEWGGFKTELDNTIISALPDPPSKTKLQIIPGGGTAPPKKSFIDILKEKKSSVTTQ